ncbi:rna-dependent rna polymerase [Thozetella sp. PMI_491]|nr:rna-dependent rna polymerase [Thozetella sp. PMI_491]
MEIFMRNVPLSMTGETMRIELGPVMEGLSILNYHCEKSPKKRVGYLTVLHKSDGEKFLEVYGQITPFIGESYRQGNQSASLKNLMLMGSSVICAISKRLANDNILRGLCNDTEVRRSEKKPRNKYQSISFDVVSLACGHYMFYGGDLTFIPEQNWIASGTAKLTKRNLVLRFPDMKLRIRIPIQTVQDLIWSSDSQDQSLNITLREAPRLFRRTTRIAESTRAAEGWPRVCAIDAAHANIVAQCLVYRLEVVSDDFLDRVRKLEKLVPATTRHHIGWRGPEDCGLLAFPQELDCFESMLKEYETNDALPFNILFLLQALVWNGYLHPKIVAKLAQRLCSYYETIHGRSRDTSLTEAVSSLLKSIPYPAPHVDPAEFQPEFVLETILAAEKAWIQSGAGLRAQGREPQTSTRIYRVIVTPTSIRLVGRELEVMNRVLRKFPDHQDYFMRVQFSEENGQHFFFNQKIPSDNVYDRFSDVMMEGITIAGRKYAHLGYSHSSLRSHTSWFLAPFTHNGCEQAYETIKEDLGDFSSFRSPARCAARMGQVFSETPYALSISENNIDIDTIDDVRSADGLRVFSDGIGTYSLEVGHLLAKIVPRRKSPEQITCYQIRYAGYKGMIALDTRQQGRKICFRPSMRKFVATMDSLEICDMGSKPISLVLNRHLIKIMEDIGVRDRWFTTLQEKALGRLRRITLTKDNVATFLKFTKIGEPFKFHSFLRSTNYMDYRKDSFLRRVVEAVILRELRLIKYKARIPVQHGVTLFGVMDETGYLAEGEVYVTYNVKMHRHHKPPPGEQTLLVSRSPALHPGDVQRARNRIPPEGHALRDSHRNCIVFSQQGHRDLPSQLGGGDLDGDLYNIIWDQQALVCGNGRPLSIHPPADYHRTRPQDIGRPVIRDDMVKFFIDFLKTDHVGTIATRHVITADNSPMGTRDFACLKLARLHSTAVDYSKTGLTVDMKTAPKATPYRPHFLSTGNTGHLVHQSEVNFHEESDDDDELGDEAAVKHKYYRSRKILGHLYHSVDENSIWGRDIKSLDGKEEHESRSGGGGASESPAAVRVAVAANEFWESTRYYFTTRCEAFGIVAWADRSNEAQRIRYCYEEAVLGLMDDFSEHSKKPLSELEVFVGFIINKNGVATQRQRNQSIKLKDEFERVATSIVQQIRSNAKHDDTFGTKPDRSAVLELCLACLHVGCMGTGAGLNRLYGTDDHRLESFKVVAASLLVEELARFEKENRRNSSQSK